MKYKIRNKESDKKKHPGTLSAKKKMLLLILWTVVCVSLYMVFGKYFAVTTVQVCEVLLLALLCGYFYLSLKLKDADEKSTDALEDKRKYLLILIIPLIGVITYDFLSSSIKMLVNQ